MTDSGGNTTFTKTPTLQLFSEIPWYNVRGKSCIASLWGYAPSALPRSRDIDGFAKMFLQANIFAHGIMCAESLA